MKAVKLPTETAIRLRLPEGQAVAYEGRVMRLVRRSRDRARRMIFEDREGIPRDLSDEELIALQKERKLRLLTPGEADVEENGFPHSGGRPRVVIDLGANAKESEQLRDDAFIRHVYVHGWLLKGCPGRSESNLRPIVDDVAKRLRDPDPPSPRTVLRWIADYLAYGQNLDACVPQIKNKGNFTDRLVPDARKLLKETVEEYYLVDTRPTGVSVYVHVRRAFARANKERPADDQLTCPSINSVYFEIDEIDRFTGEYCRVGPRSAHHLYRAVGTAPEAKFANEIWEIDHTQANCIAIHAKSGLAIGRPYLTVIIDRFSRMIVGVWLSFYPPSASVVFAAMRNAILPKDDLLRSWGIVGVWHASGKCRVLIPDNGAEFKSLSFVEACLNLGMDVQYTPVLRAWYKGKVERVIQTLLRDVFERVPGSTYADIFKRSKEKPPESIAVATLDDLWRELLNWVVNVYNARWHRGVRGVPNEIWQASASAGIDPPINPDRLDRVLSVTTYRAASRKGILFAHIYYTSPRLALFHAKKRRSYIVKINANPADISTISFIDPDTGELCVLEPQGAFHKMKPRTLESHRLAVAMQNANPARFGGDEGLIEAWAILDDRMRAKTGASGSANRREAAAALRAAMRVPGPEDPSAYDVTSTGSIADEIFADAPDIADAAELTDADDQVRPTKRPKKAKSSKQPAKATHAPPPKASLVPDEELDLEAISRLRGLTPLNYKGDDK